eukprot:COSAG02_NODE_38235_length_431_cov_1.322289_1_plen_69_part_00
MRGMLHARRRQQRRGATDAHPSIHPQYTLCLSEENVPMLSFSSLAKDGSDLMVMSVLAKRAAFARTII